jgi:hypothetical protein
MLTQFVPFLTSRLFIVCYIFALGKGHLLFGAAGTFLLGGGLLAMEFKDETENVGSWDAGSKEGSTSSNDCIAEFNLGYKRKKKHIISFYIIKKKNSK